MTRLLQQSEFLGCYCQTSPHSHVLIVVLPVYQVALSLLNYLVLYIHLLTVLVVHVPIYYQSGLRKTYRCYIFCRYFLLATFAHVFGHFLADIECAHALSDPRCLVRVFGSTAIGVKALSLEVETRVDNEVLLVGVILAQFNHFLVLILKFSKMKAKIVLVLVDISEHVLS